MMPGTSGPGTYSSPRRRCRACRTPGGIAVGNCRAAIAALLMRAPDAEHADDEQHDRDQPIDAALGRGRRRRRGRADAARRAAWRICGAAIGGGLACGRLSTSTPRARTRRTAGEVARRAVRAGRGVARGAGRSAGSSGFARRRAATSVPYALIDCPAEPSCRVDSPTRTAIADLGDLAPGARVVQLLVADAAVDLQHAVVVRRTCSRRPSA